jgi:hypothetical protein
VAVGLRLAEDFSAGWPMKRDNVAPRSCDLPLPKLFGFATSRVGIRSQRFEAGGAKC